MDFNKAQETFAKLLSEVAEDDRSQLLNWIERRYFISMCRGDNPALARRALKGIADTIKEMIPFEGVLSTETLVTPIGENADFDSNTSLNVDAFLYSDFDLDELDREGKLDRNYCKNCLSRNVEPLTFISHSTSVDRIEFIFESILPSLKEGNVLDIGSRIGSILYGAYTYTEIPKIIGIEMNKELCDLQNKVISKHNMTDRIEIICDDVCNQASVVFKADVVFLMNVFEFFLSKDDQVKTWHFLKDNIKSGAIIISVPSLETTLANIPVGFDLKTWVKLRPITDPLLLFTMENQPEIAEVCAYDVL